MVTRAVGGLRSTTSSRIASQQILLRQQHQLTPQEAEQRVRRLIRTRVRQLESQLRRECPVETGAARRSIRVQQQPRPNFGSYRVVMYFGNRRVAVTAGATVPYFPYLVGNRRVTDRTRNGRIIRTQWFPRICRNWFESLLPEVRRIFRLARLVFNPEFIVTPRRPR